jgi:hypothetical protein
MTLLLMFALYNAGGVLGAGRHFPLQVTDNSLSMQFAESASDTIVA